MLLVTAMMTGCSTDTPLAGPATRTIVPDYKWDMVSVDEEQVFYTDMVTWGNQTATWQLIYRGVSEGLARIDQVIRKGAGSDAPEYYRRSFYLYLPQQKGDDTYTYFALVPYQPFSGTTVPKTDSLYMIQVNLLRINSNSALFDVAEPPLELDRLTPFAYSGLHWTMPIDWHPAPEP